MFEYSKLIDIDAAITNISASDSPEKTVRALVAELTSPDAQLALNSILRRASGGRNLKVVEAVLEAGAKSDAFYNQAVLNAGDNVGILRVLHRHGGNISLSRSFSQAQLREMATLFDLETQVKMLKTKPNLPQA